MILVTGSTGLVGSHLLFELTKKEGKIRALYRDDAKIETVKTVFSFYTENITSQFSKIEWIKGDITDIPSLNDAFKEVTIVYHCAALVSFNPDDYHKLRKINIEGTANIVNLCIENSVKKLCYVSSIAAVGEEPKKQFITEETEWNTESEQNVYAITKYGAEMEVWRGTQEGLNAVIVNPGIIIGPGYWNSSSGKIFPLVKKGMTFYTKGVAGYIAIFDVVNAMVKLTNSEVTNQRFIVVSENIAFNDFVNLVAKNLNVNAPKTEAKNWLLQIAWRLDWLKSTLFKGERQLTKQMAKSATTNTSYSSEKLLKTLENFKFTSIKEAVSLTSQIYQKQKF